MAFVTVEELKTLLHPYYIVNLILSLSFLSCKLIPPVCEVVFAGDCTFEMRETEILFFLLMIVMIRARKTGSLSIVSYFSNAFVYCKVANTVLWFFTYKPYGLLFLFFFLLQGLLLPQPTYSGPQKILYFRDGKTFKEEISREKKSTWIIEFYTAWNPSCVNFAPVFAELSEKYALDNLKFGKVDVGRFPEIAAEFGISDSAFSKQLPTIMLFKDGSPVMYRPLVDGSGKLLKFIFNKENVITTFDLNNMHSESKKVLAEKEKSKKASSKANSKHAKAE